MRVRFGRVLEALEIVAKIVRISVAIVGFRPLPRCLHEPTETRFLPGVGD